jgi:hypothetical protein
MARTNLDFPDPINKPVRQRPIQAPLSPPNSGLLTPTASPGPLVTDQMSELRKQTELLRFIAAWVMATGLVSTMALLGGAGTLILLAAGTEGGPVAGIFVVLGLIVLLVIAVGLTLTLRRVVFHLFKIRA